MPSSQNPIPLGDHQGLALPIELEEGGPPVYAESALAIISGLIVFLLIWANIAHVRETSLAPGEIAPSEAVRRIAHLEGGIVERVNAEEGDIVKEGEELVRLRAESSDGSFARYGARRAALELRIEQLTAQAEGRSPDFSAFEEEWPALALEHQANFDAAAAEHLLAMRGLEEREAVTKAELDGASATAKEKAQQKKLADEQLDIQEKLIEGGFTSKQALLEAKSGALAAAEALSLARTRLVQARKNHNAAIAEKDRTQAEFRAAASKERAQAADELAEVQETLIISEDRDARLAVRAPTAGIINHIAVTGGGDVVRPGEIVAEIVPIGAKMIADVRVSPKDIGHIDIGQDAEVTVTTFDPKKHGVLNGKISHISADSFIDETTGDPYYKVHIDFSGAEGRERKLVEKLSPGMETSVKIITNKRSMMVYLLKPIVRSVDNAFSER